MKDEILESYIKYDDHIMHSYPKYDLYDLHTAKPAEEYLLSNLTKVTRKKVKRKDLYDFKFFDDLYFISKDLKYCTANLFFLQPLINNPTKEDGKFLKNPFDTRYMMYVNMCYQLTYNYYDKIGDLLDSYFDTGLTDKVYFNRVIHNFPKEYKDKDEYKWLLKILETDIKSLSVVRDEIVHFTHLETKNFYDVMDANFDKQKLEEIQKVKESYPELFQKILSDCIIAFKTSIALIDRLPDKPDTTT